MKRPVFLSCISAAVATIICGYFGTQYLGRNIMYVISGAIAGTGITAFMVDRITGQIDTLRSKDTEILQTE
jgi:hypothetical protein